MKKILLMFLLAAGVVARAQVVIIANPGMKVESVSKDDLRDVFTGASSNFRYGPHARPVLLNKGKVHDEFMASYVGMKEMEFRSGWVSLVFSGKMVMPVSFETEAEVVDYVEHHPFTIGYVRAATPHDGVKVLAVK